MQNTPRNAVKELIDHMNLTCSQEYPGDFNFSTDAVVMFQLVADLSMSFEAVTLDEVMKSRLDNMSMDDMLQLQRRAHTSGCWFLANMIVKQIGAQGSWRTV